MLEQETHTHCDIAIVGGGMVGLAFANLLAECDGLRVILIDGGAPAALDLDRFDPRVVALSKKTEALLRKTAAWEQIIATRACPYFDMQVWDGDGTADIHFDCAETDQDNLGHIVENSVLVHALQSALSRVDMRYHTKVEAFTHEGEQSLITLSNGDVVAASLLVAADGAHSCLRDLAGFQIREWDYGHSAIVTTVQCEKPHQHTAWQRFSSDGPLAFLPLTKTPDGQHSSEENLCSIVWSIKHALAESLMALDDEAFAARLTRTFESTLGKVSCYDRRLSFPLTQRHATRYTQPGIVLVGDAAHTIHPLAGQGANLGMYDVGVLAEEVSRAWRRGVPLHDASVSKRYERRRQSHNLIAMSTMEGFKRLFGSESLPLRWLRNEGLRRVNSMPFIKQKFSLLASGRL